MSSLTPRGGALLGGVLLALTMSAAPAPAQEEKDPFAEARRRMEEAFKRFDMAPFGGLDPFEMPGVFRRDAGAGRLGVALAPPTPALADQLDLPEGQGLVINDVRPDSPAQKAGLKKNDVLLELAGKPVPSRVAELRKMLAEAPSDKPLDAVVLRKGAKQTLKGLKLPEAKAALPADPFEPPFGRFGFKLPADAAQTTIVRDNDRFTATQKSGKVTVEVRGHVADGKAQVEGVTIDDDGTKRTYDKVADVPAEHRKRVEALSDMASGGRPKKNGSRSPDLWG